LAYSQAVKSAVAIYGVAGGLLIAALKFAEYRFLVVEHSIEIYGGLIAAIFSAVGIWLGLTLTRREVVIKEVPAPREPFVADEARVRQVGLTPRELEILQLMARGLSTREMAATLFVSENTVKTHAARVLDKLGANRRIKAVEAARGLGIIP
jgi:NarL family two-component system response regulator LiaR